MSSGRDLLGRIDRMLERSRSEFRSLDIEVQRTGAALADVNRKEISAYQALARQRLAALDADTFIGSTTAADRESEQLLAERERAIEALAKEITANDRTLADLAGEEEAAVAALDTAETALETLLAQVDTQLAADAEHQAQVAAAQRALEVATNAAEKTREAQAQRETRRQPYDDDPLFSYLWRERYGTSDYRGGLIKRFMDGLVARHVRYETARRNYHTLNEIPRALAAHTERLEAVAAGLAESVAALEAAADDAAGAGPLRDDVERCTRALAGIEEQIDAAQAGYTDLVARRRAYAGGRDPQMRDALKLLTTQLRQEPIPDLERAAALTPEPDDDRIVAELAELREDHERLSRYLDDHRDIHGRRADRLNGLVTLRRRYRDRGFDRSNSVIDDRGSIERVLEEFVRGLVSSERLWRSISNAQRFRRSRMHASGPGSIGRTRLPRMPRSVRLPRGGGRRGGGGFRTKGGF